MITLLHPYWLVLAVPLGVACRLWFPASRLLRAFRVSCLVLILLGLCGLTLRLQSRAGTLIVVADHSASMPERTKDAQKEIVRLLQDRMGPTDSLGVVSFGQETAIDRMPTRGTFSGFQGEVGGDASNLAAALDAALAIVPRDAPGRILVLSDGRWTGRDPSSSAASAAGRGIGIDYRCIERTRADDLAVDRIDAPASVAPGESFVVTAWVRSPVSQDVEFKLKDREGLVGERTVAEGARKMTAGLNRLTFRDRAKEGGVHAYTLTVTGGEQDPIPGNNKAKVLVGVEGPRPILHVTLAKDGKSGLAALLAKGGLKVRVASPDECRWTLEELMRYSAVVLENVPADRLGHAGMETLALWVKETGAGLMMTGGRESYGPGGYHKSALDPILPVSMELKNEHRKLSVAIVVALDRSGSMAMTVAGGRKKMELANLGTIEVLNLLGPNDEFGCLAVDTVPHVVAPLATVTDKKGVGAKVKSIESMGGGIYVHEALVAASKMISSATAGTRHIILFSDAQDSEEPGDYKTLLDKITRAGITVSVIGLGKSTDVDGKLLEDIARLGKGRCYFTDRAEELPRLFVQDTFVIARNTFLDQKTPVRETEGLRLLTGRALGLDTSVGGYNLCYLKKEADLASVTLDEYKSPLVSSWNVGAGRVLCYTGEADGKYAGDLSRWAGAGEFYVSLARWTAGKMGSLPDNMVVSQEVRNGTLRVSLHLDPDRKRELIRGRVKVGILKAEPGLSPRKSEAWLTWTGADTLAVDVPLVGSETAVTTVEVIPGEKPIVLPPACLPYSPELKPQSGESGRDSLDALARATGGMERDLEIHRIWEDLPPRPRRIEIAPWLLSLAVILVLLEVLERRTGLLSRPQRMTLSTREERRARHAAASKTAAPIESAPAPVVEAPIATPTITAADPGSLLDAMRKVRARLKRRE